MFAFSDGLSSGELKGMTAALGPEDAAKFRDAEGLPLDLIAVRLPEEEVFFKRMQELVWSMTQEMFSSKTITPGKTKTSDLVWWWRQRVNDLGLDTWFQPSVSVQRKGMTQEQIGSDPMIQPGDLLHCDVGITASRLNTDTQHNAYVLRPGETDAPEGLKRALANGNALQDIVLDEITPGRSGNEILAASLQTDAGQRYQRDDLFASHRPARPWRGTADRIVGLPGRRARTRRRENDPVDVVLDRITGDDACAGVGRTTVRMAQEEDAIIGADGKIRWALQRQDQILSGPLTRHCPKTSPPRPQRSQRHLPKDLGVLGALCGEAFSTSDGRPCDTCRA